MSDDFIPVLKRVVKFIEAKEYLLAANALSAGFIWADHPAPRINGQLYYWSKIHDMIWRASQP